MCCIYGYVHDTLEQKTNVLKWLISYTTCARSLSISNHPFSNLLYHYLLWSTWPTFQISNSRKKKTKFRIVVRWVRKNNSNIATSQDNRRDLLRPQTYTHTCTLIYLLLTTIPEDFFCTCTAHKAIRLLLVQSDRIWPLQQQRPSKFIDGNVCKWIFYHNYKRLFYWLIDMGRCTLWRYCWNAIFVVSSLYHYYLETHSVSV